MLQRIQTLLLLGAILINVATLFVPVWNYSAADVSETVSGMEIAASGLASTATSAQDFSANPFHIAFFALNIISALFLLLTIFQYNNRPRQSAWTLIGMILVMVEIVALVLLTVRGPYLIGEDANGGVAAFGFAFPVVAVILLWIGRKRILADEALVKSVDRLR